MKKAIVAWGPAALWAALLFLLSAQSGFPVGSVFPHSDKVAHFFLYAALGAALAWGDRYTPRRAPAMGLLLLGTVFAASDEWHQAMVPGRSPSALDFAADVVGLMAGYLMTRRLLSLRV